MLVALVDFSCAYDGEAVTLKAPIEVHPLKVQTLVSKPAHSKPNAKPGFKRPGGKLSGPSTHVDG